MYGIKLENEALHKIDENENLHINTVKHIIQQNLIQRLNFRILSLPILSNNE